MILKNPNGYKTKFKYNAATKLKLTPLNPGYKRNAKIIINLVGGSTIIVDVPLKTFSIVDTYINYRLSEKKNNSTQLNAIIEDLVYAYIKFFENIGIPTSGYRIEYEDEINWDGEI